LAAYSASAGGFGSFLLGLNKKTYELSGPTTPGNAPGSYKEPGIGWMTGFLLAISFVGLLTLLPLRKVPNETPVVPSDLSRVAVTVAAPENFVMVTIFQHRTL
jgi:hypothetical protein